LIRFQADADLRHKIVMAVRLREPAIDFASATDSNLRAMADPDVLEFAAAQGRILVTHDRRTMADHFRDRLATGKSSPGVFVVSQFAPLAESVDSLVTVWSASNPEEWQNQLRYLPSLARHSYK
jgi:predicted nuclease of predicted toxin-antitoxin system